MLLVHQGSETHHARIPNARQACTAPWLTSHMYTRENARIPTDYRKTYCLAAKSNRFLSAFRKPASMADSAVSSEIRKMPFFPFISIMKLEIGKHRPPLSGSSNQKLPSGICFVITRDILYWYRKTLISCSSPRMEGGITGESWSWVWFKKCLANEKCDVRIQWVSGMKELQ